MTQEKFKSEITTSKEFFQIYCHKKSHKERKKYKIEIVYKEEFIPFEYELCDECKKILDRLVFRLQQCPYEKKGRCRVCKTRCYEKSEWREVSKVMRFSAISLGLSKLKKSFGIKKS